MRTILKGCPTVLLASLLVLLVSSPATGKTPTYDEAVVKDRLQEIEDPLFELKYNNVVRGYITGYLIRNRRSAELITGRSLLYFPIIESYLQAEGMPEKLKYLPVVESALRPHAISPVGACGLWQFMPGTASDHGLRMDDYVDERLDPHKSTKAALGYLKREYEKYGSWQLALAAYNGGSGRVARAVKRGRSKDFWRIRRYLPRETRNYVPAYIAATYLMEHYKDHDIAPDYPELELQITESIKLHNAISFYRIAQLTGLTIETIETLNPAYKRDLIPANDRGHYLILPKRVMPAVEDYLKAQRLDHFSTDLLDDEPVEALTDAPKEKYERTLYYATGGETMAQVAHKLKCSVHQLRAWNPAQPDTLSDGQALAVYFPKELRRFQPFKPVPLLKRLPTLRPSGTKAIRPQQVDEVPKLGRLLVFYTVQERQSLREFALKHSYIFLPDLLHLNSLDPDDKLKPGDAVKAVWRSQ
ncbi:MAG: transglycosylase SLT domain-containing protein [Bacteroidetes bacterium]|nr:transglycosylase SLT domain-containing protein [Bacteroidota bacterium]